MPERRTPAILRRQRILDRLDEKGFETTIGLADWLSVSEMTVRRDFDVLTEEQLLTRTHGGAISLKRKRGPVVDLIEPEILERESTEREAKLAIAHRALHLISDGQSVALDIGSTASLLSDLLHEKNIRVFTSSLKIACGLKNTQPQVYVPPGKLTGSEPSVTGMKAKNFFGEYYFDIAFIGASGITEEGLFDYSLEDTEIKRALIERSKLVVALLDSSKFNRISVAHVSVPNEIDLVITDAPVPANISDSLESAGARIEIASIDLREGKADAF